MSLVNGKGKFPPPPHSSDIYWLTFQNLHLRNTSGRPPHMPNFVKIGLRVWGRTPSLSPDLVLQLGLCTRYLGDLCGFQGRAIERCQTNFTTTDTGCHENEIWEKLGYNLACVGNITEMLAPSRVLLLNHVRQMLPRPTLVAMALWQRYLRQNRL